MSRDPMVEGGSIVSSPDRSLWCVVGVDDEKVILRKADDKGVLIGRQRGGERIEVTWVQWMAQRWELRFP
jgi:hypothetical protein